MPGQSEGRGVNPRSALCASKNTQIYEGTNQIQRVVMARQLLKG
jgi:alkylation response protein AidB-like acyl-CoA dehydrogenase